MLGMVFLGTFDSEKFWRDDNSAKLPEMTDGNTHNIVMAMDELLFPLCGPRDILVTRVPVTPVFKGYLEKIGFSFAHNTQSLQDHGKEVSCPCSPCVFELLERKDTDRYFQKLLKGSVLSPYAVLPHTALAAKRFDSPQSLPAIENVQKVNSKIYSHEMHDHMGLKKYGIVIRNSVELEKAADLIQGYQSFLLKDPYGVSGKGNLLITSKGMLKRIEKHLAAQEVKGLKTCLLMEPYLDKACDFSCQLQIDPSGTVAILSVQNIYNNGLVYLGSMTADATFVTFLEQNGYFEIMNRIAAKLYQDGYFGDVCIDSMILKNNEIVPIVEINARKSMGLINQHIDRFLSRFETQGCFMYYSVGFEGSVQFEDILAKLAEENVLFDPDRGHGVIPLSANALFINRDLNPSSDPRKTYKGRFYISTVASTMEKRQQLMEHTKEILRSLSFMIY